MFEIYAYQNIDSLSGIFNAVAAMIGSGNYLSTVALVVFVGFVVAFLAYAFAPEKLIGWKWLGTVLLVYSLLFLPRVNVQIIDKTGGTPPQVVANVPLGLAMFGGLTSQVGNVLTELFETAFQTIPGSGGLPAEMTYQQHGMMFGNQLVKYTRNTVFLSPQLRTDLIAFIDNCTKYDLLDGTVDPVAFAKSDNIWGLMGTPNPARLTPITTGPGVTLVVPCTTAYPILNAEALTDIGTAQNILGQKLNPTLSAVMAGTVIGPQITATYVKNKLAAASSTATDILLQNAMINAINDTSQITGQKTNDPASLLLSMGRAQAVAQTNASWINGAQIAEETMPMFRNTIEAMCYALFPIIILLLFMTHGAQTLIALKLYLGTLIWVQLWPPVYAILNYMGSIAAAHQLASAANYGGGMGMTLTTASSVYSSAISEAAVVGYLVISVPVIAWAAIKGIHAVGVGSIAGTSALQGTVGAASGQAAMGNGNMGNLAFEQQSLGPVRTSAFIRTWQDDNGTTHRESMSTGLHAESVLKNDGYAAQRVTVSYTEQDVETARHQAETARGNSIAARSAMGATLNEAYSRAHATVGSTQRSKGTTSTATQEVRRDLAELDQIAHGVQRQTGLSQGEVSQLAFKLSLMPNLLGLGGGVGGDRSYRNELSKSEAAVLNHMSQEQLGKFKSFGDRLASDSAYRETVTGESREGNELGARLTKETGRVEQADTSYREANTVAEDISKAHQAGWSDTYDLTSDPRNRAVFERYQREFGGNSAAAAVATASYLANESGHRFVTPFGDRHGVPGSFGEVKAIYGAAAGEERVNPDISTTHSRNTGEAKHGPLPGAGSGRGGSMPTGSSEVGNVKADIANGRERILGETRTAEAKWVSDHGIVKERDGRIHSTKSESAAVVNAADQDVRRAQEDLLIWQQQKSKETVDWVKGHLNSGEKAQNGKGEGSVPPPRQSDIPW